MATSVIQAGFSMRMTLVAMTGMKVLLFLVVENSAVLQGDPGEVKVLLDRSSRSQNALPQPVERHRRALEGVKARVMEWRMLLEIWRFFNSVHCKTGVGTETRNRTSVLQMSPDELFRWQQERCAG